MIRLILASVKKRLSEEATIKDASLIAKARHALKLDDYKDAIVTIIKNKDEGKALNLPIGNGEKAVVVETRELLKLPRTFSWPYGDVSLERKRNIHGFIYYTILYVEQD